MSNYPTPTADSAISGLTPITDRLTEQDLLIISIRLNDAYYTGKVNLEQIRQFILEHTTALEISGLIGLLDGKSNTNHVHSTGDITDMAQLMATKANSTHTHTTAQITGLSTLLEGKANTIHTHDIAAIGGLVSALAGKANNIHAHEITDIIGLKPILDSLQDWTSTSGSNHEHQMSQIIGLDERFAGKANTEHNHQIGNIGGLTEELQNKADVNHTHTAADFENIGPLLEAKADRVHAHALTDVGGLELALDDKADKFHEHGIDDVDGLRNQLGEKAPVLHNHDIASVDGLELELNNKSNLNHTHMVADIDGLGQVLSEKANTVHDHNVEDIAGLDAVLEEKADRVHVHGIDQVTGLRGQLDNKESVDNKVHNLDTPSDENFPTVNAVLNGVNQILIDHTYPVSSVNGLTGEVILNKGNIGLDQIDNTADKDKPISESTQSALDNKVDRVLNKFDPEETPGRVVVGDDYVTIIQKLQWQIDVMRGLLVEPVENALEIIPDGYSLKLIFEKEVKFRNNLLSNNNYDIRTLFNEIVTLVNEDDFTLTVEPALIDIEAVGPELTITLNPNWIKAVSMARLDSVDQGGEGTGILHFESGLNFRNLVSIDGSLVNPLESSIDLTIHTNLSQKGIVHTDEVYDRAVILGTWAAIPNYSYQPEDTVLDFIPVLGTLRLNFSRQVLVDDIRLGSYVDGVAALLTRLFEPSEELDLLLTHLVPEKVNFTVTDTSAIIQFLPGFITGETLATLDADDKDGIHRIPLTFVADAFTSIDGEDIVLGRSAAMTLLIYANTSAGVEEYNEELYNEAIVVAAWNNDLNYLDLPATPVSNLNGSFVVIPEPIGPVSDLMGVFVDE